MPDDPKSLYPLHSIKSTIEKHSKNILSLDSSTPLVGDDDKAQKNFESFVTKLEEKIESLNLSEVLLSDDMGKGIVGVIGSVFSLPPPLPSILLGILRKVAKKVADNLPSSLSRKVCYTPLFRTIFGRKYVQKNVFDGLDKLKNALEESPGNASSDGRWGQQEWKKLEVWMKENQESLGDIQSELGDIKEFLKLSQPQLDWKLSDYKEVEGSASIDMDEFLFPSKGRIPFVGREKELEMLKEFLYEAKLFSFWFVTGPSGSGKTRLAIELMYREFRDDVEWDVGFVETYEGWGEWVPMRPTFIIVDYFTSRHEVVNKLLKRLQTLNSARDGKEYPPVRLMILDHSFEFAKALDDSRFDIGSAEQLETWKENLLYREAPLSLESSVEGDDMLRAIVQGTMGDKGTQEMQDNAERWLKETKGASHPLFAALCGLAVREETDFREMTRRGLIEVTLRGKNRLLWQGNMGEKGEHLAGSYVCSATALGGNHSDDKGKGGIGKECLEECVEDNLPAQKVLRPRAWENACRIVGQWGNDNEELQGLFPDIMGETLFLIFMESDNDVDVMYKSFVSSFIFRGGNSNHIENFFEFCYRTSLNLSNDTQGDAAHRKAWFDFLFLHTKIIKEEEGVLILTLSKIVSATSFFSVWKKPEISQEEKGSLESDIKRLLSGVGEQLARMKDRSYQDLIISVLANAFTVQNTFLIEELSKSEWDVSVVLGEAGAKLLMLKVSYQGDKDVLSLLIKKGAKI